MLFLLALAISILFVAFTDKKLKAHPYPFYVCAALVTALIFLCDFSGAPQWINKWVIGLFSKGAIGTALFVIVMYTGALKNGTRLIGKLMRIRGELSIFAAILVLAHNLTYGRVYFKYLFFKPERLSTTQLTAAIISIILITLMLVLTVTSFPQVRRKMKAKSWKKLQRSAYLFYGLIYVHILLINVPYAKRGMSDYIFNVAVYSIVFVSYAVMRVRKYLLKRSSEKIKKINICAVIVNVFVVICVVAFAMPHGSDDENQAYAAASETKTTEKNDSTEGTSETTAFLTASSEDESTTADEETESTQAEADTQAETSAQAEADTQAETSAQAEASTQTAAATQAATQAATEATTTQAVTTTQAEATTVEETTTEEATTAKRTYKADGDYTGSATVDEFEYEVRVTITIENDDISNVAIKTYEEFVEDEEYAYKAASALKSRLLAQKSTSGVDAVSGATYTSNAIFKAFENALESALN